MTQAKGLRGKNLSTIFTLASELLGDVIHAAANPRHFPPKFSRELGEASVFEARRVLHSIHSAESQVEEKDSVRKKRDESVGEAFAALDCLEAELNLNFLRFRLKAPKGGELVDKVTELRSKLKLWAKAVG